jgi:hypothetical protein
MSCTSWNSPPDFAIAAALAYPGIFLSLFETPSLRTGIGLDVSGAARSELTELSFVKFVNWGARID